jgi:pSer/pThr/pTyr-binding forkhead associated (FHA) protein
MPRVVIKHQTGSRAHQTDYLDFVNSSEVLIGRDQACALAYDENRDATVSRKHARIVHDAVDPNLFTIENLSGNGTFVNDRRIASPTALGHGSTVKLGLSGPSFAFEIDPPPASESKLTVADFGDASSGAMPTSPRVLISHRTGSRAPQTQDLDFTKSREVLIGRDPTCAVAYDENRDPLVSHEQARIVQNAIDPNLFTIENLSRSNGTYINGHKIGAPVQLSHGSTVKFGRSGPSFVFEIDPPPPGSKVTVLEFAEEEAKDAPEEAEAKHWWDRIGGTIAESGSSSPALGSGRAGPWNRGKIALAVALALLVAVLGAAFFVFAARPKDSASILEANGAAVVSIDVTWRLFDPESGRQAYHWYVPRPGMDGTSGTPGTATGQPRVPVFVRMTDGAIEPVLILDDERDTNRPIGGHLLGSGCVVHENGFILTGSQVAAPFNGPYVWSSTALPALLIDPGNHTVSQMNEFPAGWVPSGPRFVITRRTSVEDVRMGQVQSRGRRLEGRLDTISIGFAGSENRINAKVVGMSANNRMALLKVDPLHSLHSVVIDETATRLSVTDPVYLIGYGLGGGTPKNAVVRLGSVVRTGEGASGQATAGCPGCYRISDSGTDPGFNGGPVFNDHGRLVGVFLSQSGEQERTFAVVPVEQAADLLGLSRR